MAQERKTQKNKGRRHYKGKSRVSPKNSRGTEAKKARQRKSIPKNKKKGRVLKGDSQKHSNQRNNRKLSSRKRSNRAHSKTFERKIRMFIWRSFTAGTVVLLGLAVLFLSKFTNDILKNPIPIYTNAKFGTLDTSTKMTGVVIRDEVLVSNSSSAGVFQYKIDEGSRIKKGDIVCITTDYAQLYELQEQKTRLDEQIFTLEKANLDRSYFYDELYRIDNITNQAVKELYASRTTSLEERLSEFRKNVENITQQRISVYTKEPFESTKGLLLERSGIVKRMSPMQSFQNAESSGLISYYSDNFEYLKPEDAFTISKEDYISARKARTTILKEIKKSKFLTGIERPIYRLVVSDTVNIVTFVDNTTAQEYLEGKTYTFTYMSNSKDEIALKLISLSKEGNKTRLVFETSQHIEKLLSVRTLELLQSKAAASGLLVESTSVIPIQYIKIPNAYIESLDGKSYVMLPGANGADEIPVEIIYTTTNSAYIEVQSNSVLNPSTYLINPKTNELEAPISIENSYGIYLKSGEGLKLCPVKVILRDEKLVVIEAVSEEFENVLNSQSKILKHPKVDNLI